MCFIFLVKHIFFERIIINTKVKLDVHYLCSSNFLEGNSKSSYRKSEGVYFLSKNEQSNWHKVLLLRVKILFSLKEVYK